MTLDSALMILIIGTLILLVFTFTLVAFLITHKRKRYKDLLEKQAMENSYQTQLLQSRLEVQEQSFRYLSEEIHDNIGQLLSFVKMQLYNIRNNAKEPEVVAKATAGTEMIGKAITDLRNISHILNSAYIDSGGLEAAIQKDLDYICSARELKCQLHRTGDAYSLGNERELLVFRIVQEAIANALKHASPTAIDVFMHYTPEVFTVVVQDNGAGFDTAERSGGLGLNNMTVRAKMLNGELNIDSAADAGTTVTLNIRNRADSNDTAE